MRWTFSSWCLTLSRLFTYSGCVFSLLQMAALLYAVRRITRWVLQHGYTNTIDGCTDFCYITLNLIYKYAYLKNMWMLTVVSTAETSSRVSPTVWTWQKLPVFCYKGGLANVVVLFTLSYFSIRLWKILIFRIGLMFGMAQCKVDLNLTAFLWMHMIILSVTMYVRQLLFVSFVDSAGHRTIRNVPKKMLLWSVYYFFWRGNTVFSSLYQGASFLEEPNSSVSYTLNILQHVTNDTDNVTSCDCPL